MNRELGRERERERERERKLKFVRLLMENGKRKYNELIIERKPTKKGMHIRECLFIYLSLT